jgi:histidinol-phosphatase
LRALGPESFLHLVDSVSLARGYGDAWGPALVLSGVVDVWMECDVHLWDIAPFPVLFEEAGARFSDLDGVRRWPTHSGFAANPVLHEKLIQIVRAGRAVTSGSGSGSASAASAITHHT